MAEETVFGATGRRKSSIAQVRLSPGKGKRRINDRSINEYFLTESLISFVEQPFNITQRAGAYNVSAQITGGGISGQAGALRLGISRALIKAEPDLRPALKKSGLLTRDSREVERKKYGRRKARRGNQFSKR
jgi:small subunit ribosomal protein S9